MTTFINISAYKFCPLAYNDLVSYQQALLQRAESLDLKGTILLSEEGINVFFSGTRQNVDNFIAFIESFSEFSGLPYKESLSDYQPFTRMLVRIKKEIISMGRDEIKPAEKTGQHLSVQEFNRWYESNKDMVVLDTRNDYEVALGTFKDAMDLNIETFRAFPDAVKELPKELKDKPVVTFCTGGIRCEKSTAYLKSKGFKNVYHLKGGILNYFNSVPKSESKWKGECFVFDDRVSVKHDLTEGSYDMCHGCRMPITNEDKATDEYIKGVACPSCFFEKTQEQKARYMSRQKQVDLAKERNQKHIGPKDKKLKK